MNQIVAILPGESKSENIKQAWKELHQTRRYSLYPRWIWSLLPTSFLSKVKSWLQDGCKTTRSSLYPINKQFTGWLESEPLLGGCY